MYFLFFIPCLFFSPMTSSVTSFCYITFILQLHRLFEQLNLIITKYLWVLKLFIVTRGTFRKRMFLIQCLIYDLWRHLLTSFCSISLILPLYRLFEQLHAIFTKYLWGIKLFILTKETFWENILFNTASLFWPMTTFVTSLCSISLILLHHCLFEQLNLIFSKYI